MTGYGQASADLETARLSVELRTVNHRYADLRLRLPQELAASEREVRRKVLSRVQRGRVELNVNVEPLGGGPSRPQLNHALLNEVLEAVTTLRDRFRIKGAADLGTLLTVPAMFRTGPVELAWDETAQAAFDRALGEALELLDRDRCREGEHLRGELRERLASMLALAKTLRERASAVPRLLRDRLLERLQALGPGVELDPARVAQEAVLLADRADVTEELVRLDGHLSQAGALIEQTDGQPVGKRLDFLLQEIQRETNTINSKSSDLDLSRTALALKAEIEKFREQVQNLE